MQMWGSLSPLPVSVLQPRDRYPCALFSASGSLHLCMKVPSGDWQSTLKNDFGSPIA